MPDEVVGNEMIDGGRDDVKDKLGCLSGPFMIATYCALRNQESRTLQRVGDHGSRRLRQGQRKLGIFEIQQITV